MNNPTKMVLGIAAFALLLGTAVFAYNTLSKEIAPPNNININEAQNNVTDNQSNSPTEKIKTPDFTVLDSNGNQVQLSTLMGKPLVLNFWASWCTPCKDEMPTFQTVYNELGDEITFVIVNLVDGQRETMATGQQHIETNNFTFPVYYDTQQEAAQTYQIFSIPTTYFINKDGYIVTGTQGTINEKTLRKGIELIQENNTDQ